MREKKGKPLVHGCKVHHVIFCPCRMCNVNVDVDVDVDVVVQKYEGKHTRYRRHHQTRNTRVCDLNTMTFKTSMQILTRNTR